MSDFGITIVKEKIENIEEFLKELEREVEQFETLIEEKEFEKCKDLDDAISLKIKSVKIQVLLNKLNFEEKTAENFISLTIKNERYHDKYRADMAEDSKLRLERQMSEKIIEVEKELEEISKLKSNFMNIFAIFAGILGFIFINFNVFNSIGELSLTHILTVVTLLNISFIGGIVVLIVLLRSLIIKEKTEKKPLIIIIVVYSIVALLIILLVHLYGTTVYLIK